MPSKLFLLILGCKPNGRHTEQHDVFFGVGNSLKDLLPQIENFWPDGGEIHIDSWRAVTSVNGYSINIVPKQNSATANSKNKLFFINLGGYKPNDLEEYHYKLMTVATKKTEAIAQAKQTAFYQHNSSPHVDDKYGVDVDDIYEIADILPASIKEQFTIVIDKAENLPEDKLHIGYLKLDRL
jgi:Domain of Unknown Function (DUF1543)